MHSVPPRSYFWGPMDTILNMFNGDDGPTFCCRTVRLYFIFFRLQLVCRWGFFSVLILLLCVSIKYLWVIHTSWCMCACLGTRLVQLPAVIWETSGPPEASAAATRTPRVVWSDNKGFLGSEAFSRLLIPHDNPQLVMIPLLDYYRLPLGCSVELLQPGRNLQSCRDDLCSDRDY